MGCYTDDFLFIHIPKTGGTAVKKALWDQVPGMQGQRPAGSAQERDRQPSKENPFPIGHIPLRDCERLLGRPAESFKAVVAVIRNPYAQQVSQWLFWLDRYMKGGRHEHDLAAAGYSTIHGWLDDPRCDFHRWYAQRIHPSQLAHSPANDYAGFPGTYLWWLTTQAGKLPRNLVLLRQEQLAQDLDQLGRTLLNRPLELEAVNVGSYKHQEFMQYLVHEDMPRQTMRALDLVEAKFRWAFTHHYAKLQRGGMLQAWLDRGMIDPRDFTP